MPQIKYLKPNPKLYKNKPTMIEKERQVKQSKTNGRKQNLLAMMMILIPGGHIGIVEADDVQVDLPPSDLQDLMACYYRTKVMVNESTATSIQLTTMKHSSDGRSLALWKEERQLRITSSNVGKIAKRRSTTKVGQLVRQLLYSTFNGNKARGYYRKKTQRNNTNNL